MFNRLTNVFKDSAPAQAEGRWQMDARPALRLTGLAVLMLLPLAGIGARVAYLQTSTAELFAKPFDQTFVSYESVPSRDGRLLSADGRVLATDRQQFSVKVHYRWLEDPADPDWLKAQALARLSRSQRRDPQRIAQTQDQILAERDAMWRRLADLTGHPVDHLSQERAKIQQRVERIVASVEKRRRQKDSPPPEELATELSWRSVWEKFSRSITTPPARLHREPLIVKEEQDYHPLLTGISLAAVAEIESHPERYPGLEVDTISWRDYPQDSLAAHVIGVRKPLTAEEAEERRERFSEQDPLGYQVGDRIGRMGLERMYDQHLHGLRGKRRVVRNRRGEIIQTELVREPRSGNDLVLTLNAGLQQRLEALLDENLTGAADEEANEPRPASAGASLVVLDVHTGTVRAAVSAPRFSLMDLLQPTPEDWESLNADPRRPFFHRAANMAVAPGSVFKAVSAVALLESGQFDPDQPRHCQGFLDRPDRHRCYIYRHFGAGHGELTLSHALSRSCNVYFFQGARAIGPGPLVHWAESFGIGQRTGIDLPGEQAGNLPRPPRSTAEKTIIIPTSLQQSQRRREPWYPGETLGLAIGQSRLTATPLQMARVMAAIANEGFLVRPHLIKGHGPAQRLDGEHSSRLAMPEPQAIPGLSEGTLARVREGLEMVVAHPQGTAYKTVRLPGVKIAGKTGTAEVGGGLPDHAWFAGYVPADRPKYAFAIILEHAGSGGTNAGPVARQAVEILLEQGLLQGHEPEQAEGP